MKGQSEVFDPRIDWQVAVDLPDGQSMQVPQAKIVGGGSSINGGTALRHTTADAMEWERLGNDAWDCETTARVYDSMEGDKLRGTKGPHPIVRAELDECGEIQQAFVKGAKDIGFEPVVDLNAKGSEGVGPSPVCRDGDRRISAANTFIDPIRHWDNLIILANTHVDQVLFDGNRVTGVSLDSEEVISATQAVVLCAGAIFTPAILQRSGIGPRDLLESLNIPVIANLPVGHHLSDHPCIPVVARPLPHAYRDTDYSLQMQARWSSNDHPGATDLQLICFSYLFAEGPDPRVQTLSRSIGGTGYGHLAGIGCNVNKPTSEGRVRIQSLDPHDLPSVTPNYLSTVHDQAAAREVVRMAFKVITSPSMQSFLSAPLGLTEDNVASDPKLDAYINSQYSTTYHFCCSCRMASRSNGGVVDQSGRVYGVERLSIADASVIPTVPACNTMWPTMLFAERIGRSLRDGVDVGRDKQ